MFSFLKFQIEKRIDGKWFQRRLFESIWSIDSFDKLNYWKSCFNSREDALSIADNLRWCENSAVHKLQIHYNYKSKMRCCAILEIFCRPHEILNGKFKRVTQLQKKFST
jgi:hypothetical protein